MTNKKILIVALAVMVCHFILTVMVGHYIAVQVGTQVGKVVADGLIEANNNTPDKSEQNAKIIYKNMKSKSDSIIENWRVPLLLISLPSKPLLRPFLKEIRKNQLNRVMSKEISKEQFYTRGRMIDYAVYFINSLFWGFLAYIVLRIFSQYKRKT